MNDLPAPTHSPEVRKTGFVVLGVLEIALGALLLLLVPLTLIGRLAAPHRTPAAMVAQAMLVYLGLGVACIVLGIGSINARRWARSLWVCLGGIGLCVGIPGIVSVIIALGSIRDVLAAQGQELPPAVLLLAQIFTVAFSFCIYVVIPGVLFAFYRRPEARRVAETLDPVERWTDRCPLPVLALCLMQVFGAAYVLPMALLPGFGSALPFFTFLITGLWAHFLWLLFAAVSLYCALGFYRRQMRAWQLYFALLVLFSLSSFFFMSGPHLQEYYAAAGMPQEQIDLISTNPLMRHGLMQLFPGVGLIVMGGYLLYLRRYFLPPPATGPAPTP